MKICFAILNLHYFPPTAYTRKKLRFAGVKKIISILLVRCYAIQLEPLIIVRTNH